LSEAVATKDSNSRLFALTLGALGVVFGDIGTSPLYALRECFGHHELPVNEMNVLGLLSVVLWSLIVVVTIKYLVFVLRADNRGEGGILSLLTLVVPPDRANVPRNVVLVIIGVIGATLLYGDGMITPAISVLSAIEGLEVATPLFRPFVVYIAVAILVGLFSLQRFGTGLVGAIFGPITSIWFAVLGALGLAWVIIEPRVLTAYNPWYAVQFFAHNGAEGFFTLGSVLLVVTGVESLYADMGHFGRAPIRLGWLAVVLPCLTLNYFGQGALLLTHPEAVENPFYNMAPSWGLYPLVFIATLATVTASQAVISGAFSLTRQAAQLGFAPRVEIKHSSAHEIGQVYVPVVNWALMIATIALVVGFQSSSALAGAYGIAVSLTMMMTTILLGVCARRRWGWSRARSVALSGSFLIVDFGFTAGAATKLLEGGWVPLLVAALIYIVMTTWRRGHDLLDEYAKAARLPVEYFLSDLTAHPVSRVSGTAIVMDARGVGVPRTLLHNIKHNRVLHERVVLLTLRVADSPHLRPNERIRVHQYRADFIRVVARYGYMETPSVAEVFDLLRARGVDIDPMQATFFFGRETLVVGRKPGLATWRKHLYDFLFRNAYGAYLHLGVPPNRVIEIGQQVEI